MQYFMCFFYCIYVSLTIAFIVVPLGVRSRITFARACACTSHSVSVACADGRPSKGKKSAV